MKVKNNKRSKRFSTTLSLVAILLMVLISTSMVSAVWWNPFTWFDEKTGLIEISLNSGKIVRDNENLTMTIKDKEDKPKHNMISS